MGQCRLILAVFLTLVTTMASASIILHGTRLVYLSDKKDVIILAENNGGRSALVQAWIDGGGEEAGDVPFVVTPPIFRLNQDKIQNIRIIYNKDLLPKDRESLYWLNVLEIPSSLEAGDNKNSLRVTFRTRIKIFFRPVQLKRNVRKAAGAMEWSLNTAGAVVNMVVKNPTPFYVTFTKARATVDGKEYVVSGKMLAPFEGIEIPVKGLKRAKNLTQVTYAWIDDMGAIMQETAVIVGPP